MFMFSNSEDGSKIFNNGISDDDIDRELRNMKKRTLLLWHSNSTCVGIELIKF